MTCSISHGHLEIRQAHQRPPISIRAPQAQKISPQPESASPSYSFPTAVAPPTAHKTELLLRLGLWASQVGLTNASTGPAFLDFQGCTRGAGPAQQLTDP